MLGGEFAYTNDPELVFPQQLTFTLTRQLSTLVALFISQYFCHCFTTVCGDL